MKSGDKCAPSQFIMYQAQTGHLPSAFDDGRTHIGGGGSGGNDPQQRNVQLTVHRTNRHVELYLRYVDTRVVIRQIGLYFNVAIRMPEELVKMSLLKYPDAMALCQKGCPKSERIDYKAILTYKNTRLKHLAPPSPSSSASATADPRATPEYNMDVGHAQSRCRREGVVDFYFDSCVFDLLTTGDLNFTKAAAHALQDVLTLYPQGAKLHSNRTTLEQAPAVNSAPHHGASSAFYNTYTSDILNRRTSSLVSALILAVLTVLVRQCCCSL